jgi:DsbC/DsbD-like thiol-disulfide interchange protein
VPSGASAALDLLARLGEEPDGARFEAAAARAATHLSGAIVKRPEAWPAAIVALVEHPLEPDALVAARPADAQVAAMEPNAPGVPTTSDHVHASAKVEGDIVAVTIKVDPGYHINAHKPSFDYLVPTDLTFAGLKPAAIAYPAATRFTSSFAPDGLDVYEGDVTLVATFPKGALSSAMAIDGTVTAQACNQKTCLPPATLPVSAAN